MIPTLDLTKYIGLCSPLYIDAMREMWKHIKKEGIKPICLMVNDLDLLALEAEPISAIGALIRKEQLLFKTKEEWYAKPGVGGLEIIHRGSIPRGKCYMLAGSDIGSYSMLMPILFTSKGKKENG